MQKLSLLACLSLPLIAFTADLQAEILWQGNFESGDMSQWSSPINPAGLTVINSCSAEGKYAGKVRLTGADEFLWYGNKDLNRSEFHHRGAPGSTSEGQDTFFGFSFYLPQELTGNKHEFGYWESDQSWQQMLRFNITGSTLSFQETAANSVFWSAPEGAAPEKWHHLALHIHWSTDPTLGFADVWLNGVAMGKQIFKTLPTQDALMFTQIGILRRQEKTVEEILIDAAITTDNLPELLAYQQQLIAHNCTQ